MLASIKSHNDNILDVNKITEKYITAYKRANLIGAKEIPNWSWKRVISFFLFANAFHPKQPEFFKT